MKCPLCRNVISLGHKRDLYKGGGGGGGGWINWLVTQLQSLQRI